MRSLAPMTLPVEGAVILAIDGRFENIHAGGGGGGKGGFFDEFTARGPAVLGFCCILLHKLFAPLGSHCPAVWRKTPPGKSGILASARRVGRIPVFDHAQLGRVSLRQNHGTEFKRPKIFQKDEIQTKPAVVVFPSPSRPVIYAVKVVHTRCLPSVG